MSYKLDRDEEGRKVPTPWNSCPYNTLMFYDWDDTLFPSTYLTKKNYRLDTTEIDEVTSNELRRLEAIVINLMNISLALGDVVIVTNGEHGWVELSAYKYFPTFAQDVLPKLQVRSARTTFQNHFPDSPLKWKYFTFLDCLASAFEQKSDMLNVLSYGDSQYEREALLQVANHFLSENDNFLVTKIIKFKERPTALTLVREIEMVINSLDYIYHSSSRLDIEIKIEDEKLFKEASKSFASDVEHGYYGGLPNISDLKELMASESNSEEDTDDSSGAMTTITTESSSATIFVSSDHQNVKMSQTKNSVSYASFE